MSEHRGLDHLPDDVFGGDDRDHHLFGRRRRRRQDDDDDEGDGRPSRRGPGMWLTLWLFIPALIATGFVLFGVHLGAQHPDAWYARAIEWLVASVYE